MRVIKKINNNAAICLDNNNSELVAIGTGIGFPKVPYDLNDLSIIQRTYYNVDSIYYDLLNTIPENILNVSIKIVDMYRSKTYEDVSSNLVFTLADHLNFAIERYHKNIKIDTPLQYDVQHLYELEYETGLKALKVIKKDLNINLPKNEASNIALHFINSTKTTQYGGYVEAVINEIANIIGKYFNIYINKSTFNYSRFVTHIQYLLKRQEKGQLVSSDNKKMFENIKEEYYDTYQCVLLICEYLKEELDFECNEEEMLYLILHVNRLCVREDCYRKSITSPE